MSPNWLRVPTCAITSLFLLQGGALCADQQALRFNGVERAPNLEYVLGFTAPLASSWRIEVSSNLLDWESLLSFTSSGLDQHIDSAGPYLENRFYRAAKVNEPFFLSGDHLSTAAGDMVIHPINHATFVMRWNSRMIYVDPVGGSAPFQGMARADLILITHEHGDHFHNGTIEAVRTPATIIVAPQRVYNAMTTTNRALTTILNNDAMTSVLGLTVEAVPAYNLTVNNHLEGVGNGYLLDVGGKRVYISGDSEDTPEMRALSGVDLAFVCMNTPYTMPADKAASAVRQFSPKVVYPYHYRNQGGLFEDVEMFKSRVGTDLGIEVRLRKWY